MAVKLLIAAAKAKKAGKPLGDLIAALGQPAEGVEYRLKISGDSDVQAYGADVLKAFEQRLKKRASPLPNRLMKASASYSPAAGPFFACPSTTQYAP